MQLGQLGDRSQPVASKSAAPAASKAAIVAELRKLTERQPLCAPLFQKGKSVGVHLCPDGAGR